MGEVGFELLYWIPFVRWALEQVPELANRLVITSRGGTAGWYAGVHAPYVDILDVYTVEEFTVRRDKLKQRGVSELEEEFCGRVAERLEMPSPALLHPSLFFGTYYRNIKVDPRAFVRTLEHEGPFARGLMSVFAPLARPPIGALESELPDDFVAARFYFRPSFPDTTENARFAHGLIESAASHAPVVILNNEMQLDDHVDLPPAAGERIHRIHTAMRPSNNLEVQTAAMSRARAFIGTYGGLGYLPPFFGVSSACFLSDATEPRSWHLELAQAVFAAPPWGSISVLTPRDLAVVSLAASGPAASQTAAGNGSTAPAPESPAPPGSQATPRAEPGRRVPKDRRQPKRKTPKQRKKAGRVPVLAPEPTLRVEGLSKRYRMVPRRASNLVPIPSLIPSRLRRKRGGQIPVGPTHVWALRDISFTLAPKTVMAIVGANGSGKSTLLRILSRMTAPTSGRVVVRGRVMPMLEMGVGLLEAEQSATRNLFLLGRYLGIPHELIHERVDAIFAFAGLEDHKDKLLKQYSSGMLRRLAFSFTVNMEPDLLLADETLSVGDVAFRALAQRRFEEITLGNMTVLFSSHDLQVVRELSDVVLWLDCGSVREMGPPDGVLDRYIDSVPAEERKPRRDAVIELQPEADVDDDAAADDDDVEDVDDRDEREPVPRSGRGKRSPHRPRRSRRAKS